MKRSKMLLLAVMMVLAIGFVLSGCSSGKGGAAAGLKDDDAIKAVQTAVEAVPGTKLTSPITILERGAKNPAGEYLYKVEYTATLADGSSKKQTVAYKISSGGINDMGVPQYNAVEVK